LPISPANCAPPGGFANCCRNCGSATASLDRRLMPIRAGDDTLIMKPADLSRRETQYLRKHYIGVFAEHRRGLRREAWPGRKVERHSRHQIPPDSGLIDCCKKRVCLRTARVVTHQLRKLLKMTPQHTSSSEGLPDLVEAVACTPPGEQRANHIARLVT